jgi:hypothetical protein
MTLLSQDGVLRLKEQEKTFPHHDHGFEKAMIVVKMDDLQNGDYEHYKDFLKEHFVFVASFKKEHVEVWGHKKLGWQSLKEQGPFLSLE